MPSRRYKNKITGSGRLRSKEEWKDIAFFFSLLRNDWDCKGHMAGRRFAWLVQRIEPNVAGVSPYLGRLSHRL